VTSVSLPLCTSARTLVLLWGSTASNVSPVLISSPPMIEGMSSRSLRISARRRLTASRSGDPGA
jgi:hypothetical protein